MDGPLVVVVPAGWSALDFGGASYLLSKADPPRVLDAETVLRLARKRELGFSIKPQDDSQAR
jgi:hypothetical protein